MQDDDLAVVAAIFFEHVDARDAKVHAALADADDDVTGSLKEDGQLGQGGHLRLILTRIQFLHRESALGEKVERVVHEASFGGKGETEGGLLGHLISFGWWLTAPPPVLPQMRRYFCRIWGRCRRRRGQVTKNPDARSGLDEVNYGYLSVHRYAHINLPTMRGLNMMMVMLERGLVHVGRYSMTGRGMSQGELLVVFL